MRSETTFPFFGWSAKKLSARPARRVYASILLLLLCLTFGAHLRSYLMTRKIQAVLRGLAEIRVDETTEEQLTRTMPYLKRSDQDWKVGDTVQHWRYTEISNEFDWFMPQVIMYGSWSGKLAYWLGFRYLSFDASVSVENGKATSVRYGLAKQWGRPRQLSYIVSAESVHGRWLPRQHHFRVSSLDDESPQYRPVREKTSTLWWYETGVHVTFTNDAPPELSRRAFQLDLGCFWSLRGCGDAREIAPRLWADSQAIQNATNERLRIGTCPDSVVQGRMRYLPDVTVLLLEISASRKLDVNEGEHKADDWVTDYELKEVIRGRNVGNWKNVHYKRTIPSPEDPTQAIANPISPLTKIGSQVLFFGNLEFDSCQFIAATPSSLDIVRRAPAPLRKPEDEIQTGLM